ncbi:hypothetical protein LAZ40_11215 [Cereibacter sphaeroides]|uniref:hypothetical protein n=1 Tax=Cereibacter sphaeroides TaxID=1063 RepID=UPI001F32637F|nr:hypothetical protein [Cereibacter sphaeroides]MCE6959617.1 hypothetical protein [Cereibacter sphaeroides]MCE6974523.1 hypothetical protein [Cereibacter sphaeroides]
MKVRIHDIDWDTEGEEVDLPKEVILDTDKEGIGDVAMEAADWLSDNHGWCVNGFSFNAVEEPDETPDP